MKFQKPCLNFERTHERKDKPKAICPINFSKVGGIKMFSLRNIHNISNFGKKFHI